MAECVSLSSLSDCLIKLVLMSSQSSCRLKAGSLPALATTRLSGPKKKSEIIVQETVEKFPEIVKKSSSQLDAVWRHLILEDV